MQQHRQQPMAASDNYSRSYDANDYVDSSVPMVNINGGIAVDSPSTDAVKPFVADTRDTRALPSPSESKPAASDNQDDDIGLSAFMSASRVAKCMLERQRQSESQFYRHHMINPNSVFSQRWAMVILVLIMYSVIAVPFRIGFEAHAAPYTFWWTVDWIVDSAFLTSAGIYCFIIYFYIHLLLHSFTTSRHLLIY